MRTVPRRSRMYTIEVPGTFSMIFSKRPCLSSP